MGSSEIYNLTLERTAESREQLRKAWGERGAATPTDERGNTLLHWLAVDGNLAAFEELRRHGLLNQEDLGKKNVNGDTALHVAAWFGELDIVEMMMSVATDLASVRNKLGETPLYVAAARGKRHVFTLLLLHSDCMARRYDGRTVLHAAVTGGYYGLAFTILKSYPDVANKRDEKGVTALHLLATTPSSFRSGSPYVLQNLGMRPSIMLQFILTITYSCIPAMYGVEYQNDKIDICILKRFYFTKMVLGFGWFREIDDVKQTHIVALALAKRLIAEESDWRNDYTCFQNIESESLSWFGSMSLKKNRATDSLILATKHGISELVLEILNKYPEAEHTCDENGKNIMHIVVEHKHKTLYEQLKNTVVHKDRLMSDVDYQGNTILHLATNVGWVSNIPLGAKDQLTWNLFWFESIRYDCYPYFSRLQNSKGKTGEELFKENHSILRENAEKATKDMNGGIMLVAALIATISYAVLFTIPGGFSQKDAHPTLLDTRRNDLYLFIIYAGNSLVGSLISLAGLVSVQLSRFHIEDFYISLPLKLVISYIALFVATSYTFTTCYQGIILEDLLPDQYVTYLIIAFFIILLVALDPLFLLFTYIYDVVRNSLTYKSQEI